MKQSLQSLGIDPAQLTHAAQSAVVATSLRALGATFELVSQHSAELKAELADWEEGQSVCMGVLPAGPAMSIACEGGRIRFLGMKRTPATVSLLFKTMAAAFLTLSGQMGAHTASIEKRVEVHGNVGTAMQALRAMAVVQKFLLPSIMLARTSKNPPQLSTAELWTKARVLAGLGPQLVSTLIR